MTMQIEIAAPASLPLGVARFADGTAALLGVTLRFPPVNLFARPSPALNVTGGRADHAYLSARRFLDHYGLTGGAEIEIELAIPSLMGLGSDTVHALSAAQAAAWAQGRPPDDISALAAALELGPEHVLAVHGYAAGGVLLAGEGVLRRRALAHADEDAWVFVLVLPRAPAGAPETLEADRLRALAAATAGLSPETGRIVDADLWPALARDDFDGFAQALRALNDEAALHAAAPLAPEEREILDLCAAHGARAWGRSPAGLALYALVRGAAASVALRRAIAERVGFFGGTVLASVADNDGARRLVHGDDFSGYAGLSPLVTGQRGPGG